MRLGDALDLGDYREFSLYARVNNLILGTGTTKGTIKTWHAARNESTDYKELASASHEFTTDGGDYIYVAQL